MFLVKVAGEWANVTISRFFALRPMLLYITWWTLEIEAMKRKTFTPKVSENVTQRSVRKRNLAEQYKPLATLVAFVNVARACGLQPEVLEVNGAPFVAPVEGHIIEKGRRLFRAAAKQFTWPTRGRFFFPGFPDKAFHEPDKPEKTASSFLADREFLEFFVNLAVQVDACLRRVSEASVASEAGESLFKMPLSIEGRLFRISKGQLLVGLFDDPVNLLLMPALINARRSIDLRRLKVCPICDRLFVAGRLDAIACSAHCLSVERQRRYRDPKKGTAYRRRLEAIRKGRDEVLKKIARKLSLQPAPPTGGQ